MSVLFTLVYLAACVVFGVSVMVVVKTVDEIARDRYAKWKTSRKPEPARADYPIRVPFCRVHHKTASRQQRKGGGGYYYWMTYCSHDRKAGCKMISIEVTESNFQKMFGTGTGDPT